MLNQENILAIIKWGPILFFLIVFLWGLIVGMIKGNRKVIRRLIYVAIYTTAVILLLPMTTRAAMTINVNGVTLDAYVNNAITSNETITSFFDGIPGLLDVVLEYPSAIISLLLFFVFMLIGLPLSFPLYWIYMAIYALISKLIFKYTRFEVDENGEYLRTEKGKKIKKKKHHRIIGGVLKGAQYVVVTSLLFTPLGFVTRIYKAGQDATESKNLGSISYFENFKDYLLYLDAYNNSFIGFVTDNPLNEAISNYLTQVEVEGEKTNVEEELATMVKAAVYVEESGLITVLSTGTDISKLDLSQLDLDKIDQAITLLFETKSLDALMGNGVNYVLEAFLSEQLVNITNDTDIVSKIKYESSEEVKQELLAITGLLRTIINAKLLEKYNENQGDYIKVINAVSSEEVETILNKVLTIKILSKAMPSLMTNLLDDYGLVETLEQSDNNEYVTLILDAVNLVKSLELASMSSVTEGDIVGNIVNSLYVNGTIKTNTVDALAKLLAKVTSSNIFDDILVAQLNNVLKNFDINLNAQMLINVNTEQDWKNELVVLEDICKLYKDFTTENKVDFLTVNNLMNDLKETKAMILAFPIAYKTLFPMLNIEIDPNKIEYIDYTAPNADEEEAKFYAYWKEQLVSLETISEEFAKLEITSLESVSLDLLKVEKNEAIIANILATAFEMDLLKDGIVKFLDTMVSDMLASYEIELNEGAIANVNALVEVYPNYVVIDEAEYNVDVNNKYYIDGIEHTANEEDLVANTLNRVWLHEVDNLAVVVDTITSSGDLTDKTTLSAILDAVDAMYLLKDIKVDLLLYAIKSAEIVDVSEIDKSQVDFTKEKTILLNIIEKQEVITGLGDIDFANLTPDQRDDIDYVLDNVMSSNIFADAAIDALVATLTDAGISHDDDTTDSENAALIAAIKGVESWSDELDVIKTLTGVSGSSDVTDALFTTIENSDLLGGCKHNIMILMVETVNKQGGVQLRVPTVGELKATMVGFITQYDYEKTIFINASTLDGITMDNMTTSVTGNVAMMLYSMPDSKIFVPQYESFLTDLKSGITNTEYGVNVDNSVDTTEWSKDTWEAELNVLLAIRDGMEALENMSDPDAEIIGDLLDAIDSSTLIDENSSQNVANKIVTDIINDGDSHEIDKEGTWEETFDKLLNPSQP
ncbi:MAG: hypothetical protein IKJ30_02890 [Bacilli bacterium]|nr:hypothetical protein [Bacilli bacterium]